MQVDMHPKTYVFSNEKIESLKNPMVSQPTAINLFFLKGIRNVEDISLDDMLLTNAELQAIATSIDTVNPPSKEMLRIALQPKNSLTPKCVACKEK